MNDKITPMYYVISSTSIIEYLSTVQLLSNHQNVLYNISKTMSNINHAQPYSGSL